MRHNSNHRDNATTDQKTQNRTHTQRDEQTQTVIGTYKQTYEEALEPHKESTQKHDQTDGHICDQGWIYCNLMQPNAEGNALSSWSVTMNTQDRQECSAM